MKLARTGSLALLTTIGLAACNDANGPSAEDLALNEAVAVVAADAAIEDVQQMFFALAGEAALGASYDAAAPPRDFRPRKVVKPFPPIVDPKTLPADRVDDEVRDDELVLGVAVGGEARAYPINMLTRPTREIINDHVGNRAIAATW